MFILLTSGMTIRNAGVSLQVNLMYVVFVGQLREQFKTRFVDLRANNQAFALFATPFAITVDSVAVDLQMELIDLQCKTDLKSKFTEVAIVKFYDQYVPPD